MGTVLSWVALTAMVGGPVIIAATSPLQASRDVAYVVGGLAGVCALALMLLQPLLAAGYIPGMRKVPQAQWHRWTGAALLFAVALHIIGLYLTSPPDMIDALLFAAPTVFSVFGVVAMWGLVLTAALAVIRTKRWIAPSTWRMVHNTLAVLVVLASVVHAVMIEGAMGSLSKLLLCIAVLTATVAVTVQLRSNLSASTLRRLLHRH